MLRALDVEPQLPSRPLRGIPLRTAMTRVTLAWCFGNIWATGVGGAPTTLFAEAMGATDFQFGLLAALPFIASLLSMPAALLIERTGERKRIFLWGLYANRLLWFPIVILPFVLIHRFGSGAGKYGVVLFLWLMLVMHIGQAIGGTAWTSWMAEIVPERLRGRYFSRRRQLAIPMGIVTAFVVGWVIDRTIGTHLPRDPLRVMTVCGLILMAAAIPGLIDITLFALIPHQRRASGRAIPLREMLAGPIRDPSFLNFAGYIGTLTFAVSFMGQFVTLFLVQRLAMGGVQVQLILLAAPMLAQLLVLGVWGRACDRMGRRPVLAIASLGLVPVGFGWCFVSPAHVWLGYLLSAAGAALWSGVETANLNMVLEMAGGEDGRGGAHYVAANSVIINVAGACGGIAAGLIAKTLGHWHTTFAGMGWSFYEVLFVMSAALRLLATVVFLPRLHEPEARPSRETLRFMSANLYHNVTGALLAPLRVVRLRSREVFPARDAD